MSRNGFPSPADVRRLQEGGIPGNKRALTAAADRILRAAGDTDPDYSTSESAGYARTFVSPLDTTQASKPKPEPVVTAETAPEFPGLVSALYGKPWMEWTLGDLGVNTERSFRRTPRIDPVEAGERISDLYDFVPFRGAR